MKKILYDISSILKGIGNDTERTGIYFCAYNILKEMISRDDVRLTFYNSAPQWSYYEKTLREMLGIFDIYLINSSEMLSRISKQWIVIYKKKIYCHKNKKRVAEYFFRFLGLIIRKLLEIYEIMVLNRKININDFDFYFSPMLQAPTYILKNSKIKSVILLHDAIPYIFPEYFPEMNLYRKYWVKGLVQSMNNEELFLANSQNTKRDFLFYNDVILPHRIRVVYHACSEQFMPCFDDKRLLYIRRKYNIPDNKKYVFSLCTIEPRKNIIRMVRTFVKFIQENHIDDLILVLGGGYWEKFIKEFNNSVEKIGDFSRIVCKTGYIDDEDLPYLYSGALFFVYTSQYEGFGVPPLEAMKCRCPVIVSNNSSIPEVVGDAGILIDWDSDEQHIQAYSKYYFDEDYRLQQAYKGLLRSDMFSWEKTVNSMLAEMESDRNV